MTDEQFGMPVLSSKKKAFNTKGKQFDPVLFKNITTFPNNINV